MVTFHSLLVEVCSKFKLFLHFDSSSLILTLLYIYIYIKYILI